MDYTKLRPELLNDPVALGYVGKTDQQAADLLNSLTTGRTRARTRVENREVFNAIVNVDWPSTAINQDKLARLLSMPYVDASNANTRGIIGAIFAAGSVTLTNLQALATETISRGVEIGVGVATAYDVQVARSGVW